MNFRESENFFPKRSPFRDRTILLKYGGTRHLNNGDFSVTLPNNRKVEIKLRTGLPLFPITSPQGEAPAEYVIRQLETKSPDHAYNSYGRGLRQFCRFLLENGHESWNWRKADETLLLSYLNFLRSKGREYEFARLRHFYVWASDAEYTGFSRQITSKLNALRIPGNVKGEAVLTGDREKGPLSEEAFHLVRQRLVLDTVSMLSQVCIELCVELGANSAQFCQLRERDYIVYETNGEPIYHLNLPRSKKGDGYRERRQRPLSPQLGRLLGDYITATATMRDWLGMEDPFLLLTDAGEPMTSSSFGQALQRFVGESGLSSKIEGSLNPRRFRRTFATRLVAEGAPKEIVMDLLDHTDGQNVDVYFEMRGDSVSRIDGAVSSTLEPLVGRFLGEIVDSEADADLGDKKEQRVKAPFETGDVGIGTCGRDIRINGLCQLHPPYSCYTCPRFQPWRDADHEGLASSIREQREAIVQLEGGDESTRIVGQLDELLRSVLEVDEACKNPSQQQKRRKISNQQKNAKGDG